MAPNLLELATNHRVVKTQTEANIAELLLMATRTISRFLITNDPASHRYEHYCMKFLDVDELSDIQKQIVQLFTESDTSWYDTLKNAAEEDARHSEHVGLS
jgi:hypothetical protein